MTTKIYKDVSANAIFIEDANGVQFLNSLQATAENGGCSVHDLARNIDIVTNLPFDDFIDENGATYGNNATEVCNALNSIFSSSGVPTNQLPIITSNLSINLVEGEVLNYELTANHGVGYEWDLSTVSGITTVEGNVRKLIGGSSLAAGTYSIPVKAINYNGEDSETLTLTVSSPPFANTKSVQFNFQDYLNANASLLSSVLGRTGNGSGASDAWTVSFWFKGGTSTNSGQTIFYFGDSDTANGGNFYIRHQAANNRLRFQYGTNNNYLRFQSANNSLSSNTWHHIMVTYDGGTTGVASGSISDYYSRFTVFINGSDVISSGTWTQNNYGYSGAVDSDNLRVGRYSSGNYMRNNAKVDELAVWDGDQSANISDIYNGGSPFDLDTLGASPSHWWRLGDGDTFPNLLDSVGSATFVMNNMTAADIVNDVP